MDESADVSIGTCRLDGSVIHSHTQVCAVPSFESSVSFPWQPHHGDNYSSRVQGVAAEHGQILPEEPNSVRRQVVF